MTDVEKRQTQLALSMTTSPFPRGWLPSLSSCPALSLDLGWSRKRTSNQPSPREGRSNVFGTAITRVRVPGVPSRKKTTRSQTKTKHMFLGVRVPADAMSKPFAGGNELDVLPGRVESLIYPHRQGRKHVAYEASQSTCKDTNGTDRFGDRSIL